ncbi:MAG: choice-of-anchor D domain-containing protein [Candidatus Cloacimonetes bacterium]|nr:choice-of-anchor D domain-containing protein [Candidatus Cloacimonadota bacterium]
MHKHILFWLTLILLSTFSFPLFSQFAGGSGTEQDPWQVATAVHLNNVRNYLGDYYNPYYFIQTADIDLDVAPYNEGEGWVPIGYDSSNIFRGHYDGDGFIITGLYINRSDSDYQGLFGFISEATIRNLGMINVNVTGCQYTGGFVGQKSYGSISNCYSTGSVTGDRRSGLLVGYNNGGSISNCHSTGSVTGNGYYAGGLVGFNSGSVTNCYSNASATGNNYTGGLIGHNSRGKIDNCYSNGSVTGNDYTGGLVGSHESGEIESCYSSCNIISDDYCGGLIGQTGFNSFTRNCYSCGGVISARFAGGLVGINLGNLNNCFSIGSVVCNSYAGGLSATNQGNIFNCYSNTLVTGSGNTGGLVAAFYEGSISFSYWDIEKSEQFYSQGGEGRLTSEMIYPHSNNTYIDWDWRIWKLDPTHTINGGYPYFRSPGDIDYHAPAPAICVSPQESALSVRTDVTLEWSDGFMPEYFDTPNGFKLWLGTDNPPSNICNEVNLGYVYEYLPDPILQPNTTYYWKIVPYNDAGEAQDCPVWTFRTYNPDFSLIYPNGGENWLFGTTRTIRWTENAPSAVELSISYDGGSQWNTIATVEGGKNYFHYQVPRVNSLTCFIKIASLIDENDYDISDDRFSISASSSRPKVVLSYPSAQYIYFNVGDTVNISWTRQNVTNVCLDYSVDDGINWTEIISNLDDDSYSWLVPDTCSSYCRVRVRSALDSEVLDISNYIFHISKINLLFPLGGETFTSDYSSGYSLPITWLSESITNVRIEYSSDGGVIWSTIISSIPASLGEYNWTLPGIPLNSYMIRICSTANNATNSVSQCFTLRNPIKLINANGGGFITRHSMFNIRWKMQDIDPATGIYLEYRLESYYNWIRINSNPIQVSEENISWFVNTGLFNNVTLRAIEHGTNRIICQSESPNQLTDKMLLLFEPNGGEEYIVLTTQSISWDYEDLTSLSIYFSDNDGDTWEQIATNILASDLNYTWQVPDIHSANCLIRLQDETYEYMRLDSDLPFRIISQPVVDPTVDFEADILSGDIPLSVQFTSEIDPGVGSIASLLWDFGDGGTSTDANPLHVYTESGTYTVSLTVTNDFGGSATETKDDFITALPQTPRIELLSSSSLDFGIVYLGDVSAAQTIEVKNYGTAPLNISDVSYHLPNSQFALIDTELPIAIPVNGSAELKVIFTPLTSGAVSDSIFIHSDASNTPSLAVGLSARGEYVPPAMVEGLEVTVLEYDAHLIWEPVTTTIYDTPIEPDGYIVLYNETPYEDEHFYYFHSFTTETSFIHHHVAEYRTQMFYRIVAVKHYRGDEIAFLRNLGASRDNHLTWGEVKAELNKLRRSP